MINSIEKAVAEIEGIEIFRKFKFIIFENSISTHWYQIFKIQIRQKILSGVKFKIQIQSYPSVLLVCANFSSLSKVIENRKK